jgi:hypothetical protein
MRRMINWLRRAWFLFMRGLRPRFRPGLRPPGRRPGRGIRLAPSTGPVPVPDGHLRIFVDSSDGVLKAIDAQGEVTEITNPGVAQQIRAMPPPMPPMSTADPHPVDWSDWSESEDTTPKEPEPEPRTAWERLSDDDDPV